MFSNSNFNKMISAIIIDDEPDSASALQSDIDRCCPSLRIEQICFSAKEGIQSITKKKPDLVFLDIQMPGMNGFEMLEQIDSIVFSIIFTTAHDHFAAKAFRLSAVDYLLKPIDLNELRDAVQKVEQKNSLRQGPANVENLLQNFKQPGPLQKIALPNRDGYEFVEVKNILFCHAEGAYTKVFIENRKFILVSRTLGDIEELLPPESFVRIHHSTIVNIGQVTHFVRTDGGYIRMKTGEELAVSKSRREVMMERLGLK